MVLKRCREVSMNESLPGSSSGWVFCGGARKLTTGSVTATNEAGEAPIQALF